MSGLTEQLPALVGVIVGTMGAIFATWFADQTRWRRQQRARWDERRLQALSEYANTLKEMHSCALTILGQDLFGRTPKGRSRDDLLADLHETDSRRTKMWESVLLLADAQTLTASRDWQVAVGKVFTLIDSPATTRLEAVDAIDQVNKCRDAFYIAARASIGVTSAFAPQADWLSRDLRSAPEDPTRPLERGGHPTKEAVPAAGTPREQGTSD
jgi:hypothetical protein